MGEDIESEKKKSHRDRKSGRKADKKKSKNPNVEELTDKQKNPKAFAINSAIRAERRFRRKQDIDTKKQHVPLVDRSPIEPPPILIAVVGPPKVGKTTLIHNLLKSFIKTPIGNIKGPVTIVTGKKRRITIVECNNDINSMIDLAKVCDLALLLCDASFGFEMEIFEFLNICQVHGMPRIMGVLTHLDMIKNSKTLKTTKKTLKHRFWTEVYSGAKLFYLSGIVHGEYLRNEIKNLGRFISVMKFRPLLWRQNHSYILGDRYEDLTNQELVRKNPKCDRTISLYGYVRGVPLMKENSIHIAGFGDLRIHDIAFLPDPCPLPDEIKKRALIEKEKMIYAPFSGVGGIVYDKDAVYIESKNVQSQMKRVENESSNIVNNLIESKETADFKLQKHHEMQIFAGSTKLTAEDVDENMQNEGPSTSHRQSFREEKVLDSGRVRRKVIFDTSDADMIAESVGESESEDNEDANTVMPQINEFEVKSAPKPKGCDSITSKLKEVLGQLKTKDSIINSEASCENSDSSSGEEEHDEDDVEDPPSSDEENEDQSDKWMKGIQKARDAFLDRYNNNQNLMKLVYAGVQEEYSVDNEETVGNDDEEEIGGMFKKVSRTQHMLQSRKDNMNLIESSLMFPWNTVTKDWTTEENKGLIANCFVTGKWKDSEDANELLRLDDADNLSDLDSDMYGDFEDLETGVKRKHDDIAKHDKADREALAEKKRKLKERFDAEYDNPDKSSYYDELKMTAEKQAQLNKSVFENMPDDVRVQVEGFRPGMYVRIEFDSVPAEFITNFDPTYPLVIGSLNMGEENIGYVNVKIRKHRWYGKILKTNDPLIISLGWRRFQTIPLYSKLEDDLKYRYLKYTPEHISCNAHFWGPITPQGTGFLALQSVESDPQILKKKGFRIAATGSVQELDKSTQIMKKLKLIGHPLKIYKKTAFIQNMFNSSLEVAKFEGAKIQTVSGIRGQIKKAVSKPEGCFRATFEDKILLSDIVFCRTWFKVDVQEYYNPITTMLLPPDQKNQWRGIRTKGEIKRDKNIRYSANKDSLYTPVVRELAPFKPLIIPSKLQKALPFREKLNFGVKSSDKKTHLERVAVIQEPREQKVTNMIKMIRTLYNQKQAKLAEETKQRLQKHKESIQATEATKDKKIKQKKKEVFRKKSKAVTSANNKAEK
ncbi:hypothetical protein D910_02524 [Dendroctonus ponderosae]